MSWPPCACRSQRLVQVGPAEQQPCHLGGQIGFAPPRLGLFGPCLSGARQPADGDRRDQENRQRDPVLALGDREPAVGGMWKKFQAAAPMIAVSSPITRPQ